MRIDELTHPVGPALVDRKTHMPGCLLAKLDQRVGEVGWPLRFEAVHRISVPCPSSAFPGPCPQHQPSSAATPVAQSPIAVARNQRRCRTRHNIVHLAGLARPRKQRPLKFLDCVFQSCVSTRFGAPPSRRLPPGDASQPGHCLGNDSTDAATNPTRALHAGTCWPRRRRRWPPANGSRTAWPISSSIRANRNGPERRLARSDDMPCTGLDTTDDGQSCAVRIR
jgi:hypothetical protein